MATLTANLGYVKQAPYLLDSYRTLQNQQQVVGEILVLTTFGLGLGLLVAMQFPLLGVLNVKAGVYGTAMLLATGGLYALATVCALYPSRLAASIQPAAALREE